LRVHLWLFLPALAALILVACKGSSGNGASTGDGNGANGLTVSVSCDAIQDIDSYRYVFDLNLTLPAGSEDATATATPEPLTRTLESLTDFLSDVEGEGAFVAPDQSAILMRSGTEELEVRTIAEQSWVRLGATWQEQEPPGPGDLITPASVCADQVQGLAPALSKAKGEADTVNGIETVHFQLDETDLAGDPDLQGPSGEEGVPDDLSVDIWLEKEAGWPVRLQTSLTDTDENGDTISQDLFMEFLDINDPDIEIEPPPVSPAST
jgi:hypothetical protein